MNSFIWEFSAYNERISSFIFKFIFSSVIFLQFSFNVEPFIHLSSSIIDWGIIREVDDIIFGQNVGAIEEVMDVEEIVVVDSIRFF